MTTRSLIQLAIRGLALHKLRSTLSALGIVFGVAAVTAMLSVGEGARREILAEVGRLGINRVTIRAGSVSPSTKLEAGKLQSQGLSLADAEAISEVSPNVASLAPVRTASEQLSNGERRADAILLATTPSFARTEELALSSGRFVADADVLDAKRVIVLGHELRELLFPYDDPVGSGVRIAGEWYSVVGALEPRELSRQGGRMSGQKPEPCRVRPALLDAARAGTARRDRGPHRRRGEGTGFRETHRKRRPAHAIAGPSTSSSWSRRSSSRATSAPVPVQRRRGHGRGALPPGGRNRNHEHHARERDASASGRSE